MPTNISSQEELSSTRVGKIVAQLPVTAKIFERHKIDYCCQGNKTLAEACQERHLNIKDLCSELNAVPKPNESKGEKNWLERPLGELCDHIETQHHAYLREELPRLTSLIDKVVNAHATNHPELLQVKSRFRMLRAELEPHMAKEEQVLFPAVRRLESENRAQNFAFGTLANPIRCLEHEHDGSGQAIAALRQLTNDFTPPSNACPTYRVMLDSLARLESDLHSHIHKENQILFPRAQELERRLVS